jgi:hypothetical protein
MDGDDPIKEKNKALGKKSQGHLRLIVVPPPTIPKLVLLSQVSPVSSDRPFSFAY